MGLKIGIVGLPNVGKSTLFNAISNLKAEVANYAFTTIEPNVGVANVTDERLDKLAQMANSSRTIYATCKFIDIAGLVKGASRGLGLGNKFLSHIREVDAIVHVVRCFENKNVSHEGSEINPIANMDVIETELLLADISTVENIVSKSNKMAQNAKDKKVTFENKLLKKILKHLQEETPVRSVGFTEEELELVKTYNLLTFKKVLYLANIAQKFANEPEKSLLFQVFKKHMQKRKLNFVVLSAELEHQLSQMTEEERLFFTQDLQLKTSGLNNLTKESFKLLNLSTYFTVGPQEAKAWTFKNNSTALECARIIHSDIARGFIKAQVIKYQDFVQYNGEQNCKNLGKVHLEGKNYVVQDGDIILFHFNV